MKFGNNRMLRIVLVIYIVILIMACTLTCGFYYQNRKNAHLASMNNTLIYLVAEYKNLTENFWKYYLPVFTEKDTSYTVLDSYFSAPGNKALSPMEKQQLMHVLSRLTVHADAIRWVALYAPERSVNLYLLRRHGAAGRADGKLSFSGGIARIGRAHDSLWQQARLAAGSHGANLRHRRRRAFGKGERTAVVRVRYAVV